MSYTKQTWVNEPTHTSPLSAARLTHMEDGIGLAHDLADPYGLLVTPAGAEWGDEFDDNSIDVAWSTVTPGAGSITWTEAKHRLSVKGDTIGDTDGAAKIRSIGTSWASGSILETEVGAGPQWGNTQRYTFFLSNGTSGTSSSCGLMMVVASGVTTFFTVHGTAKSQFVGGFVGGLAGATCRTRVRIVAATSDAIHFHLSTDGITWVDMTEADAGAAFSINTLGWTPTKVGVSYSNISSAVCGSGSFEYVRRWA